MDQTATYSLHDELTEERPGCSSSSLCTQGLCHLNDYDESLRILDSAFRALDKRFTPRQSRDTRTPSSICRTRRRSHRAVRRRRHVSLMINDWKLWLYRFWGARPVHPSALSTRMRWYAATRDSGELPGNSPRVTVNTRDVQRQ